MHGGFGRRKVLDRGASVVGKSVGWSGDGKNCELILAPTLMEDERELLEEWLEECDEDEFDEYLRLREGEDEEEEM